ncbi:hypothetical protein LIER_13913 [Lithospermum erythrorhizon]|uniref:Uncharacterized protein n=1 Tax=Lithospermum erythrorhizon TaxID=34254 RepID=A0AAV3PZD0_LITER
MDLILIGVYRLNIYGLDIDRYDYLCKCFRCILAVLQWPLRLDPTRSFKESINTSTSFSCLKEVRGSCTLTNTQAKKDNVNSACGREIQIMSHTRCQAKIQRGGKCLGMEVVSFHLERGSRVN